MTQVVSLIIGDQLVQREMPDPNSELLDGVQWGNPWTLFTPAYWLAQAWMAKIEAGTGTRYAAKSGVVSELGFCMLGGYSITAELATAAFERCSEAGLFTRQETRVEHWFAELSEPLCIGERYVRYRFPNQKSRFLAGAMAYVRTHALNCDSGRLLRDDLLNIPGVGYKTASWVARNALGSDDVAILDIHLIRAGRLCRLFSSKHRIERDYPEMENRFLAFCAQLRVRPSALDCVIWDGMRAAGALPLRLLSSAVV